MTAAQALADRRTQRRRAKLMDNLAGWCFVVPACVIVFGLSIFPAVWALVLSFQKWNGFKEAKWVGLRNYSNLLSDEDFWAAVHHTLGYTAMFVPASVLGGLFLAVALNRKIRGIGIYRTAIFVPFVASAAATGILSTYLFDSSYGLVNNVLRVVGLPQPGWLSDPNQAMVVIAIMSLWGQAAFTTVIYLAALQDVPRELTEAAAIDGASTWQTFWRVVWPNLAPVTVFVTVWQTVGALQLFDLVYTTTRGGPMGATQTIVYYLWDQAFHVLQFGYGSAIAYVLFVITLVVTLAIVIYSRRSDSGAF